MRPGFDFLKGLLVLLLCCGGVRVRVGVPPVFVGTAEAAWRFVRGEGDDCWLESTFFVRIGAIVACDLCVFLLFRWL